MMTTERRLGWLSAAVLLLFRSVALSTALGADISGRVETGGYLEGRAVAETEGGADQRPGALLDLRLDATVRSWVRGHLEVRSRVGGPFEGGHPGVYNFVHTFQNRAPSLDVSEAYAEIRQRHADFRLGIQRFAWGKLDGIPPTDVVNPRDYHDPLVDDFEERKIGVPALSGSYYPPDMPRLGVSALRATLSYIPIAVPPRLALVEERWFPTSLVGGSRVVVPRKTIESAIEDRLPPGGEVDVPHDVVIPIQLRTVNHGPPKNVAAGAVAFRLGGTWHEMDWDIYHYTGPETGPDLDLRTIVLLYPLPVRAGDVPSSFEPRLRLPTRLRQAQDIMHMTGADWSAAIAGADVRAEAAVFQDRPYLRRASDFLDRIPVRRILRDLCPTLEACLCKPGTGGCLRPTRARIRVPDLFVDRASVAWGVGADYPIHGFIPLVQLDQTVFVDAGPRLIIANPETRFSVSVRKTLLAERIELELRGTYALERGYSFVFPRVSYLVRDDFRIRLGYLAIAGPRESLLGQFRNNDEFVLEARFSF